MISTFAVVWLSFIVVFTILPSSFAAVDFFEEDTKTEWEEDIPFTSTITVEYADPCKAGKVFCISIVGPIHAWCMPVHGYNLQVCCCWEMVLPIRTYLSHIM